MGASIRHLANDGNTSITGKTWPDIFATQPAATGTPEKFAVENNGDRALVTVQLRIAQAGGSDGHPMVRPAADAVPGRGGGGADGRDRGRDGHALLAHHGDERDG